MRVFIRADANPNIGMGHVMRCLSIADALKADKAAKHEVKFLLADNGVADFIQSRGFPTIVLNSDYKQMEAELPSWPKGGREKADLIIVDSYFVTANYLAALRYRGECTVYIDDLAVFPYPVDILINYNAYADEQAYMALYNDSYNSYNKYYISPHYNSSGILPKLILGPRYAPLRSMFSNIPKRTQPKRVRNILISTGGSDPIHLAVRILEGSQLLSENTQILSKNSINSENFTYHILLGALNPDKDRIYQIATNRSNIILHENISNMRELLDSMDMAVSAAGSTLYEICACGVPLITYVLADNQISGAEAFERLGLAVNVGDFRKTDSLAIEKSEKLLFTTVNNISTDYALRCKIGAKQQHLIDGRGAERIVKKII